jgi:hypothetical protein
MTTTFEIKPDIQKLIEEAYRASNDVGIIVEQALREAILHPISREKAEALLTIVIENLKGGAILRGDDVTLDLLKEKKENIIHHAMKVREAILQGNAINQKANNVLSLSEYNGVSSGPVLPTPTFHRREVPMNSGWVNTTDIVLWNKNERLDIHVGQFIALNGREPSSSELLDIMLSQMSLEGVDRKDEFNIVELARSIANNGVRKPPIIDRDGTLLDGNRRIAACYYILNSKFSSEEKKRAEKIFVWQLTEHATQDERDAVVVSLNFEPDSKQDWPEYVKAKIVFEEWEAMIAREANPPGKSRLAELKRELSLRFGYGEDPYMVNRYIRMVTCAREFEDYLVGEKGYNEFAVKHQASKYFQYFDELTKGISPGGVAHTLNQNEPFKHLVFELLYQDKFKNWTLIRNLRYFNDDVYDSLLKARDIADRETAEDLIEDKLNEAKSQLRESRIGNPNQRIEVFAKWLEAVPIGAFRDSIKPENLLKLLKALRLVERQVKDLGLEESNTQG